jgi:hypothetical protein
LFAKNKTIAIAQFLTSNTLEQQFHLPLSIQAFQEHQDLQELIQQIQIPEQGRDNWSYIWSNSNYTASKFYHLSYKHVQPPKAFIWIWGSKRAHKIRVFTWLLLMDRLNVRNILRRKKHKLQDNNYSCVLCTLNCEETTFHSSPVSSAKSAGLTWTSSRTSIFLSMQWRKPKTNAPIVSL